jgi:hypothetical protein
MSNRSPGVAVLYEISSEKRLVDRLRGALPFHTYVSNKKSVFAERQGVEN